MAATKEAPLRTPQPRSLLVFQEHVQRGMFAARHLESLAGDARTQQHFASLVDCTVKRAEALQKVAPNKHRQVQTRCADARCALRDAMGAEKPPQLI